MTPSRWGAAALSVGLLIAAFPAALFGEKKWANVDDLKELKQSEALAAGEKDQERLLRRLAEITVQFEKLRKEGAPLLVELGKIEDAYTSGVDLKAAFASRNKIVSPLSDIASQLNTAGSEYEGIMNGLAYRNISQFLGKKFRGENLTGDTGASIHSTMELERVRRQAQNFSETITESLYREATAFTVAQKAAEEQEQMREMLRYGAIGFGTMLAIAVGSWFFVRPPRYETVVPVAMPTLPHGQLPAPGKERDTEPPGAVLGGIYEVKSELGRGGMGIVFAATDLNLKRTVAIKKMRRELGENLNELDFFMKEAQVVASLKHPNIVQIHTIFREGSGLYLVFEFVDGHPLSRWLGPGKRLALSHAQGLVRQIAAALEYAHSRKIIHRDLKPSNIMIEADGAAKVMDFGIAHHAKRTVAKLTTAGAWGTPAYMPPEQELGSAGRASDVYALGVCFYEMLAGVPPFEGPNFLAQKQQMVYRKLGLELPAPPAGVDAVVDKVLRAKPEERYASASEFAAAVQALRG